MRILQPAFNWIQSLFQPEQDKLRFLAIPSHDQELDTLEGGDDNQYIKMPLSHNNRLCSSIIAQHANILSILVAFLCGAASTFIFIYYGYPPSETCKSNIPDSATTATWPAPDASWPNSSNNVTFDSSLYFPSQGTDFQPTVATYNQPPVLRPKTPLFIPFTRNNKMMRQTILGYIANGWPREDIIIVDNSGTIDANNKRLLSESNPFFLDYNLFRSRYGVSILQTPVLFNFAQLQNFLFQIALSRNWPYYFWSHMDVGIQSKEEDTPYKSFYQRVLEVLFEAEASIARASGKSKWAVKFFEFDYLSLINVAAWREIGQWDVFIPYYATDCDYYGRLRMLGYTTDKVNVGYIWDVADSVGDPESKFFHNKEINSSQFHSLRDEFQELQHKKENSGKGRNTWQNMQKGGQGEAWTYDPAGFQVAWWEIAAAGRNLYEKKWKTRECDLFGEGKVLADIWKDAKDVTGRSLGARSTID